MGNEDIRRQEDDLFAKMAKGVNPMAPDSPPTAPDQQSSQNSDDLPWEHARSMREQLKRDFPKLTDSDLDELMM
jgi:hypothetical protein